MPWNPDKKQLDLIAEFGHARMPPEKIAAALGIAEAEFMAWAARLIATREIAC